MNSPRGLAAAESKARLTSRSISRYNSAQPVRNVLRTYVNNINNTIVDIRIQIYCYYVICAILHPWIHNLPRSQIYVRN